MTDEAALLQAIRSNRHDKLAWLLYADWLEDHGQAERAAFIRMQCDDGTIGQRRSRKNEIPIHGVRVDRQD